MYEKKIIHRDLKLSNLFVKYEDNNPEEFIVKLGDYGIGKFLNEDNSITGFMGTLETEAPEILLQKIIKYENSVDIFSLGVILYQLSHKLNHSFNTNNLVIFYAKNYEEDNYDIQFDKSLKNENFKNLLRKMLKINPKNRLNWEQYFSHPFFK